MYKRIIGTVIVKENKAVQSISYNKYLPLGNPEIIVENLDRWNLDEILLIDIDASINKLGPNINLLKKIAKKKIMTPLCYAGGIQSNAHALDVVSNGADRIGLDNLFRVNLKAVNEINNSLGKQAIIRLLPVNFDSLGNLRLYDYLKKSNVDVETIEEVLEGKNYSELMVIDWKNEGKVDFFQKSIIDQFNTDKTNIIYFGGVTNSDDILFLLKKTCITAVAIGNALNWTENANSCLIFKNLSHKLQNEPLIKSIIRIPNDKLL